jgi:hypothetical protein
MSVAVTLGAGVWTCAELSSCTVVVGRRTRGGAECDEVLYPSQKGMSLHSRE